MDKLRGGTTIGGNLALHTGNTLNIGPTDTTAREALGISDIPNWSAGTLDGRYAPKTHTHTWQQVTGIPQTATRWPTPQEVGAAPQSHTHSTAQVTGLGNTATRNIGTTQGTVQQGDDARILAAATKTELTQGLQTKAPTSHTHPVAQVTGLSDQATTTVQSIRAGTTQANVGLGSVRNVQSYSQTESEQRYLGNITTTFTGTYPVTVDVNGKVYSNTKVTIEGSTGNLTATIFTGSGSGLTGTSPLRATGTTKADVGLGNVPNWSQATFDGRYAPITHTHTSAQVTGLGDSATRNVGTQVGTVQQGNDTRITGAVQGSRVVQVTGTSTTNIMSQKAVTDNINQKAPKYVVSGTTLTIS